MVRFCCSPSGGDKSTKAARATPDGMERNKKQKIVLKNYNIIRNSEQGMPKNKAA